MIAKLSFEGFQLKPKELISREEFLFTLVDQVAKGAHVAVVVIAF